MKSEINNNVQVDEFHPVRAWAEANLRERLQDLKCIPEPRYDWILGEQSGGDKFPYGLVVANMTLSQIDETSFSVALQSIYASLKVDGLFLGAVLGGESFPELRASLIEAQVALYGGASPLFPSLIKADEAARLLAASGFAHPALDRDSVSLTYPDLSALLSDFALLGLPKLILPPPLFDKTQEIYRQLFLQDDSMLSVTLDVLFLHGWRA